MLVSWTTSLISYPFAIDPALKPGVPFSDAFLAAQGSESTSLGAVAVDNAAAMFTFLSALTLPVVCLAVFSLSVGLVIKAWVVMMSFYCISGLAVIISYSWDLSWKYILTGQAIASVSIAAKQTLTELAMFSPFVTEFHSTLLTKRAVLYAPSLTTFGSSGPLFMVLAFVHALLILLIARLALERLTAKPHRVYFLLALALAVMMFKASFSFTAEDLGYYQPVTEVVLFSFTWKLPLQIYQPFASNWLTTYLVTLIFVPIIGGKRS